MVILEVEQNTTVFFILAKVSNTSQNFGSISTALYTELTEPAEKNLIPLQPKMVKLEYIQLAAADYLSKSSWQIKYLL